VVAIFVALRLLVPKVNKTIIGYVHQSDTQDLFQKEVRIVFLILIGTVITFELLGLHPIIGSFLAGLILSDSISSEQLMSKIRTLSYGIFIPVFFVVVGVRTDLSVLSNAGGSWWIVAAIVASSVISKLVSGYLGAIASKFSRRESLAIATTSIPQLTTTLAVAFIGLDSGIIDHKLIAAMVILILVTTALSPLLLGNLVKRTEKDDSIVSLPAE
jgi:Kef-type K+ transport system membrane component KefB